VNIFSFLKTYSKYKPEILEAESAVADAQKGNMPAFWSKPVVIVEPILWAAGGGAATSIGDYLGSAISPISSS
jgi:hypothetical protein